MPRKEGILNIRTLFFASLFFAPYVNMAIGVTLNIGGASLNALTSCTSDHKLNIYDGTNTYCIPATTDNLTDTLHVSYNGTTYSLCNGACVGEWVMPEEPPEPVDISELDPNCAWSQTDSGAYLLSDGNQYFDTNEVVDANMDLDFVVQVVNGKSARIMGTMDTSCFLDFTLNNSKQAWFRAGSLTTSTSSSRVASHSTEKLRYVTSKYSSTMKRLAITYENGQSTTLNKTVGTWCTGTKNLLIFKNDHISTVDSTNSGGMKLYYVKTYNSSGTMTHYYQPVAAGTNICGYTVPANAMWDSISKQVYLPGGTGTMGYGTDTE